MIRNQKLNSVVFRNYFNLKKKRKLYRQLFNTIDAEIFFNE